MPIYEYQCIQCDCQFELLIRGSEKPACPSCDGKRVEKQLSVAAAPKKSGGSLPISPRPNMGAG